MTATAATNFSELDRLVGQARSASNGAIDSVTIKLGWDDYNDETYETRTIRVDFFHGGQAVDEDVLDGIPGVRKLEREADGLASGIADALDLSTEGFSELGQEELEIVFKADGSHVLSVTSDESGRVFSGTIGKAVDYFETR